MTTAVVSPISSEHLTVEAVGISLRQALVNRIKQIVQISQESLHTDDPHGVIYPTEVPKNFGGPGGYDLLRKEGYLCIGLPRLDCFEFAKKEDQINPMHFIAKEGTLASDAIEAAVQGPTIAECGVTCQIARYAALMDVLGKDKFNKLFSGAHRINIGYLTDDESQPMRYFVGFTASAIEQDSGQPGNRPIKAGNLVLIKGVRDYEKKHPYGTEGSFNVICVDDTQDNQRFTGLGLPPEGATEQEIESELLQKYNLDAEDPFAICPDGAVPPKITQAVAAMKTHKARRVMGYDISSAQGFKPRIVLDLMTKHVEEVNMQDVISNPVNQRSKHLNGSWQ